MKQIPLTQGKVALVDDADYEELSKYSWWFVKVRSEHRVGYAARPLSRKLGKRANIMMHRHILGLPSDMSIQVDHIDGNGLNNQRHNLRICNNSQNHMNKYPQSNNTSGCTGVYYCKRDKHFDVYINVMGKRFYCGNFKTFDEAKQARIDAEIEYFGEFRRKAVDSITA